MKAALKEARQDPADIGSYINAHGTSTRLNDVMETVAAVGACSGHRRLEDPDEFAEVDGRPVLDQGFGKALEAAATAACAQRGVKVPPTIKPGDARSRLRPRLRPEHREGDPGPDRHLEQFRLRRPERLAGPDPVLMGQGSSPRTSSAACVGPVDRRWKLDGERSYEKTVSFRRTRGQAKLVSFQADNAGHTVFVPVQEDLPSQIGRSGGRTPLRIGFVPVRDAVSPPGCIGTPTFSGGELNSRTVVHHVHLPG